MAAYRVVYTDNPKGELGIEREILAGVDAELVNAEEAEAPVEELIRDADGVIVSQLAFGRELIETLDGCRVISRTGIGFDNVDLDAATERGIYVTNVPDYCIPEVSDHVLALILALQRRITAFDRDLRADGWDAARAAGLEMHRIDGHQTLGLVAFGRIARAVAGKAAALGFEVLAFDPYLDAEAIRDGGAEPVDDLDDLLDRSDVVSVHTPLTPETEGMIGARELDLLGESGYIINAARGGVIDETALVTAVREGRIAGAGLDVYADEPFSPDNPLADLDEVVLTPHVAFRSVESERQQRETIAWNVRTVLEGEVPDSVVNPAVLE